MTEPSPNPKSRNPKTKSDPETRVKAAPRPRRSTKSVVGAVAAIAGAATIAAFGGLSLQMANGNDPVLAAKTDAKKQPVIRKVVVVKKVVPSTSSGSTGSSYGYTGSSGSYSSSGSSYSPPVAVAPAPAPVVSQPS